MTTMVYQPTDLVGRKRRAFLDQAKAGRARLRDSDGTSIVALSETELEALDLIATWSAERDRLVSLLAGRTDTPTTVELGSLAWMHTLDRSDQIEFANELREAMILAWSRKDGQPIRDTVHAWMVTAAELEDPVRREVLLGRFDDQEYVDAGHLLDDSVTAR